MIAQAKDIILSDDESTEDEDKDERPDAIASKDVAGKEQKPKEEAPVADELLRKKKPRLNRPFNEDLLVSNDGIFRIYNEFPAVCQFGGRGSEAKDIRRLMTMYKEWAFQLHPGMAFEDSLMKSEVLGSKGKVRSCLTHLREQERERYLTDVLGIDDENDAGGAQHRGGSDIYRSVLPDFGSPPASSASKLAPFTSSFAGSSASAPVAECALPLATAVTAASHDVEKHSLSQDSNLIASYPPQSMLPIVCDERNMSNASSQHVPSQQTDTEVGDELEISTPSPSADASRLSRTDKNARQGQVLSSKDGAEDEEEEFDEPATSAQQDAFLGSTDPTLTKPFQNIELTAGITTSVPSTPGMTTSAVAEDSVPSIDDQASSPGIHPLSTLSTAHNSISAAEAPHPPAAMRATEGLPDLAAMDTGCSTAAAAAAVASTGNLDSGTQQE